MELGANCPLIVMPDADIEKVAQATVASGYGNAGQVCISTQRVLVDGRSYGDFLDALVPKVEALRHVNPIQDDTQMGPMIRDTDAARVGEWIQEAVGAGARVVAGGDREGAMYSPNGNRRRQARNEGFPRGIVRSGRCGDTVQRHQRRHCPRQRFGVRTQCCALHQRSGSGHALRQRGEVGQPAHQLRPPASARI